VLAQTGAIALAGSEGRKKIAKFAFGSTCNSESFTKRIIQKHARTLARGSLELAAVRAVRCVFFEGGFAALSHPTMQRRSILHANERG